MSATAEKIMMIRHAEKPGSAGGGVGVRSDGTEDPESLTVRGWTRAGALVGLFTRPPLRGLAPPRLVYASGVGKRSNSLRPQETIGPLCEKLDLTPMTDYLKDQFDAVADDAMAHDGPVLICWEHKLIPDLADRILGDSTTAPRSWPEDRFDVVWVFDLDRAAGEYRFKQIPQSLLAGDRPAPIT